MRHFLPLCTAQNRTRVSEYIISLARSVTDLRFYTTVATHLMSHIQNTRASACETLPDDSAWQIGLVLALCI